MQNKENPTTMEEISDPFSDTENASQDYLKIALEEKHNLRSSFRKLYKNVNQELEFLDAMSAFAMKADGDLGLQEEMKVVDRITQEITMR